MSGHQLSCTDGGLVIKRFVRTGEDQPTREWLTLMLLHRYAPGLAPEPVSVDLDGESPSIVMTLVAGEPLGDSALTPPQLRAIAHAFERMHTSVPRTAVADFPFSRSDPETVQSDLRRSLAAQPRPVADPVVSHAYDEALHWLSGQEVQKLDDPDRVVLGRADHNQSNFLWDGERMRLVDFEYAGRSDRPMELAELVEHISARRTPEETWHRFLDGLDLSPAERRRLLTLRRLFSMSWLLMLLPGQAGDHRNPPGTLRLQAERTLAILNA